MAELGWIKLHRQIKSSWIWNNDEPFDRRSAWIDMLLCANHERNKVCMDGQLIDVERGSFITSQAKLARRWGWDRKKVKRFLEILEQDKMVTVNSTTRRTTVTIDNYGKYQDCGTSPNTSVAPSAGQVLPQVLPTNKNDKNDKNNILGQNDAEFDADCVTCHVTVTQCHATDIDIEEDIDKENVGGKPKRFMPPTIQEVTDYCNERKNEVDPARFVDFYEAKGWMVGKNKMKNWKAAVRTWERNNSTEKPSEPKALQKPRRFERREINGELVEVEVFD